MAAAILLAPTVGVATVISKRKQARRAQAAANKWSNQFPLSDNPGAMQQTLSAAQLQLKTLRGQRPKGGLGSAAALKKWRADEAQLVKWISTIKDHIKDLKSGLDVSSTNIPGAPVAGQVVQASTATAVSAPAPRGDADEQLTTEGIDQQTGAAAKKPNYLLYAGIAVGVILLVRALKK